LLAPNYSSKSNLFHFKAEIEYELRSVTILAAMLRAAGHQRIMRVHNPSSAAMAAARFADAFNYWFTSVSSSWKSSDIAVPETTDSRRFFSKSGESISLGRGKKYVRAKRLNDN